MKSFFVALPYSEAAAMCSVRPCGRLSLTCEGGRAAVTALSASPPCLPGSPCHQSHLQQPSLSAPGNDSPLTSPAFFRRTKVLTLVVSFSFLVQSKWSTLYCVLHGCCHTLAFPLSPHNTTPIPMLLPAREIICVL